MAQLQLRSHSVGDIIDASFTVYRKRFGPMIAIALMLVFIPFVVGVIGGCTITELQTSCDTAIGWIGQIASQIGMVIAAAAAMLVAAEAYVGTSSDWRLLRCGWAPEDHPDRRRDRGCNRCCRYRLRIGAGTRDLPGCLGVSGIFGRDGAVSGVLRGRSWPGVVGLGW